MTSHDQLEGNCLFVTLTLDDHDVTQGQGQKLFNQLLQLFMTSQDQLAQGFHTFFNIILSVI